MARNYRWGWQISSEGFKGIMFNSLTAEEIDKGRYVNQFLDPSVHEARCGWHGVCYCVCDVDGENRREFVLMFGSANDTPNMARWIDVTGESKGSIAEAVWSLVFA